MPAKIISPVASPDKQQFAISHDRRAKSSLETQQESGEGAAEFRGPSLKTAVGFTLIGVGFFLGAGVISDNSFLTHLTTGDIIRQTGAVPVVDVYSATAPGEPWTVQSWFASLIYDLFNDYLGAASLRLLGGTLTGLITLQVWRLTNRVPSLLVRLALVSSVVAIGSASWGPRPLLFGLLGLTLLLRVLQSQLPAPLLVPIMWVWVNTHGSFPLAVLVAGAFVVGAAIDGVRKEADASDAASWVPVSDLKALGWVAAGIAGGAINPLGLRILIFPFQLLSRRTALDGVAEWSTVAFDVYSEWIFLAMMALAVVGQFRNLRIRLLVPTLGLAFLGCLAVRNIPAASVMLAVIVGAGFEDREARFTGEEPSGMAKKVVVVLVGVMMVAVASIALVEPMDLSRYPVAEVEWLLEHDLVGNPDEPLIHRDTVGNYLIYLLGTDAQVFVDDRFDFYPEPLLRDHLRLFRADDGYGEILDRYGAAAVLWEKESKLGDYLVGSSEWSIEVESDDWIIARRRP